MVIARHCHSPSEANWNSTVTSPGSGLEMLIPPDYTGLKLSLCRYLGDYRLSHFVIQVQDTRAQKDSENTIKKEG